MRDRPEPFELDADTAVSAVGDGRFTAEVSSRWSVGGGPNGGYLAALLLRAVLAESRHPDLLTMTVHYLSRPAIAGCTISIRNLRTGRGHSTFAAELAQDGEVRCASLLTLGLLRPAGEGDFQPPPPAVPSPEASIPVDRAFEAPALWERLENRAASAEDLFSNRSEPGEATTGGWTRLRDGRETDALAALVFLDCWPPAVFSRTLVADLLGAPTLEYTVHMRNRPASDWCYARFETATLAGGYVEEDGRLWDERGLLVAESRQLARYLGGGARPAA